MLGPGIYTEMSIRSSKIMFLGSRGWPLHRADNLTDICELIVEACYGVSLLLLLLLLLLLALYQNWPLRTEENCKIPVKTFRFRAKIRSWDLQHMNPPPNNNKSPVCFQTFTLYTYQKIHPNQWLTHNRITQIFPNNSIILKKTVPLKFLRIMLRTVQNITISGARRAKQKLQHTKQN
jgi:hypothetical protein